MLATSERGEDAAAAGFRLPPFRRLLIVFGGVAGLESAMETVMAAEANGGGRSANAQAAGGDGAPPVQVHRWLNTSVH